MSALAHSGYSIRPAMAADRPALLGLFGELQAHECTLHPNREAADIAAEPHWTCLEHLVEAQDGRVWIAESANGEALGFVLVVIEQGEPYLIESDRRSGYVSDLMISAKAQGLGIGKALMATVESYCREAGLGQLRVGVLCSNTDARRFYDSIGFQPYEMSYEKRLDDLAVPEVKL